MKKEIRNYEENKISHTAWSDSLIGAIGAGSTFAYLTSTTGTVTNTFTVGNVNFDDDPRQAVYPSPKWQEMKTAICMWMLMAPESGR